MCPVCWSALQSHHRLGDRVQSRHMDSAITSVSSMCDSWGPPSVFGDLALHCLLGPALPTHTRQDAQRPATYGAVCPAVTCCLRPSSARGGSLEKQCSPPPLTYLVNAWFLLTVVQILRN